MIDEVLYVVVVEAIGVSHDGRRDPRWNGKLGCTSGDDEFDGLTSHGMETIAQHQNDRKWVPR